jgi:hypothetical protein
MEWYWIVLIVAGVIAIGLVYLKRWLEGMFG